MKRNSFILIFISLIHFLFFGCTALVIGGAALGASAGTYYFVSGELKTDYFASFDKTWSACEKTIADMRGIEVTPYKEIARGNITSVINGENVKIDITYKSKDLTTVSIRVGLLGNKLSSQLLHDKIAERLANN
jgi:hypothetical protein